MPDIVGLTINGTEYTGWEALTITRSLDSVADAFSLSGAFDPNNPQVKSAFKPFGYQAATVNIDGELVLTGTIESVAPSITESDRVINVQGRSKTGVLVDCAIDGQGFQFAGLSLLTIAQKLSKPFGIEALGVLGPSLKTATTASTIAEASKALKDAKADPGQVVFEFLNKIAQDSGLLLTSNVKGNLVITKIQPGAAPIASLLEGYSGFMSASATYNGAGRFSRYKVLQQQDGAPGISGTADDAGVKVYRPSVSVGAESDAKDVKKAAQWRRAMALAGSVSVSVKVTGWRAPNGTIWTPGNVVTLLSASAFILKETTFIIAGATLTLDASQGRTTDLRLVLPATYSGEMPGSYPWE